jgi:AcrR family transcriptional regulator
MTERSTRREQQDKSGGRRPVARIAPTQKRSRERYERILACAIEVMTEKGSDAFKMSDIVERTGIGFGSLYQYFPDKSAVIATLAERTNAIGRDCVRKELAALRRAADLRAVLRRITESYYDFFQAEPAVRLIWQATQADRDLQKIDEEDGAFLTGLLSDATRRVFPDASETGLADFCQLQMVLIAAAVRHAITLPPMDGRRILDLFMAMLPDDLPAGDA